MPANWLPCHAAKSALAAKDATTDHHLKRNGHRNIHRMRRFGVVTATAILEKARAARVRARGSDLFVTATGNPRERVLGRLPADRIK